MFCRGEGRGGAVSECIRVSPNGNDPLDAMSNGAHASCFLPVTHFFPEIHTRLPIPSPTILLYGAFKRMMNSLASLSGQLDCFISVNGFILDGSTHFLRASAVSLQRLSKLPPFATTPSFLSVRALKPLSILLAVGSKRRGVGGNTAQLNNISGDGHFRSFEGIRVTYIRLLLHYQFASQITGVALIRSDRCKSFYTVLTKVETNLTPSL